MLLFFVPNFQFVLSKTSLDGGSCDSRENTNLETKSDSSEYSDINLCILRSDHSVLTLWPNPQASFSKQTICTLHNTLINKPKNFILARFVLSPKNSLNVSDKTVTLFSSLIFIVENVLATHFQHIEHQDYILIKERICINKNRIIY